MVVEHASLEVKLADEMVSILFGGLDNRSLKKAAIAGKTARKRSVSRGNVIGR
jgi:hypothetical protein